MVGEPPQDDVDVIQASNQLDTFAVSQPIIIYIPSIFLFLPNSLHFINPSSFQAYLADPHKTKDREPVFNPELGLAMEKLPEGYSLSDLWDVN